MTADAWRGIAAEETDQLTAGVSALLRRRARRLLTDLLRPHKRMVTGSLLLVVTANLAALAGPWLVGLGIDQGIPPLIHGGDLVPLALIVAGFSAAVAVQAVTTRAFVGQIGKLGEDGVLDLRQRLFAHFSGCRSPFTSTTPPAASSPGRSPTSIRSPSCSRTAWTPWCRRSSRCCSSASGCCCWTGRWPSSCWPDSARWPC